MMSILGIKPGPVLGVLYDHMLEYRMSNGQVGEDRARVELVRFYNEYKSAQ
jgi:poly(A) polymerase